LSMCLGMPARQAPIRAARIMSLFILAKTLKRTFTSTNVRRK
jgi:hypothetical protein